MNQVWLVTIATIYYNHVCVCVHKYKYSLPLTILLYFIGNEVERSYTPIENLITPDLLQDSNQSDIQLMIKLYKDGVMSKHLSTLKTGE